MEPLVVLCECGRGVTATAGDAGASFPCECGRTIEVPPLELFRDLAEEERTNEELRTPPPPSIAALLLTGCGGLVALLGLGLLIGNITGLFPTFLFAGAS
jgi:hypothetical protein